jgi:hypothetical protein
MGKTQFVPGLRILWIDLNDVLIFNDGLIEFIL